MFNGFLLNFLTADTFFEVILGCCSSILLDAAMITFMF